MAYSYIKKIQTTNNSLYWIRDDGARRLIAPAYQVATAYNAGSYIIYEDVSGSAPEPILYRVKTDVTVSQNTGWAAMISNNRVEAIPDVAAELKALKEAIAAINQFEYHVCTQLDGSDTPSGVEWFKPAVPDPISVIGVLDASANTMYKIYMAPAINQSGKDYYREYITLKNWNEGAGEYIYSWEKFGDTDIDLSSLGDFAYADTGTATFTPTGTNTKSAVTISPKTTSVYSMSTTGSVTNGSAATHANDTFTAATHGTDSFTANIPTEIDTTKFSGGSFTQGVDSFTTNTPTRIDTTKFSGGSFSQGTDSFTANRPTIIDTSKFSGGSFTRGAFTQGSFTQGTFTQGSFTQGSFNGGNFTTSVTNETLSFSFTAATHAADTFVKPTHAADTFVKPTHAADSFTGASFQNGFYTAGSAASFTQGTDSFTAAILNTGFYTAGSAASFTQGTDTFTAAKLNTGFYTAGSAASFVQGSFSGGSFVQGTFTPNSPTVVTLPGRTEVTGLWNGYNTGSSNTYAAAQTFSGTQQTIIVSPVPKN